MNKIQPAYKRKIYFLILDSINQYINYTASIAKSINYTQAGVHRAITSLKIEGYVKTHRIKNKNINIYSLTNKGFNLLMYFKDLNILNVKYKNILRGKD